MARWKRVAEELPADGERVVATNSDGSQLWFDRYHAEGIFKGWAGAPLSMSGQPRIWPTYWIKIPPVPED